MARVALFIARFCSSAWLGAATLFVIVGVLEVTRGGLDSRTRDILVGLRFPPFYLTGAILVGLSWAGACVSEFHPELPQRRRAFAILSLLTVMALMAIDYFWIYTPLAAMVDPPGQARPAAFITYHEASKNINFAGLFFSLIAAFALNCPSRNSSRVSR